jgi:hypothetical protein
VAVEGPGKLRGVQEKPWYLLIVCEEEKGVEDGSRISSALRTL